MSRQQFLGFLLLCLLVGDVASMQVELVRSKMSVQKSRIKGAKECAALYEKLNKAASGAKEDAIKMAASVDATGEALTALQGGVDKMKSVTIPKLYKAMYLVWQISQNTRNLALGALIEVISLAIPPPFGTIVGVGLKLGLGAASAAEKKDMAAALGQAKVTKTHLAEAKEMFPEAAEAIVTAGLEYAIDAVVDGSGKAIPIIGTLIAAVKTAYKNWKLKNEVKKLLNPEPEYLKEMFEQVKKCHEESILMTGQFSSGVKAMDDIVEEIRKEKCPSAVSSGAAAMLKEKEVITLKIVE